MVKSKSRFPSEPAGGHSFRSDLALALANLARLVISASPFDQAIGIKQGIDGAIPNVLISMLCVTIGSDSLVRVVLVVGARLQRGAPWP